MKSGGDGLPLRQVFTLTGLSVIAGMVFLAVAGVRTFDTHEASLCDRDRNRNLLSTCRPPLARRPVLAPPGSYAETYADPPR